MPLKVLIVDDSNFFQHRLKEIISEHHELTVAGVASNGREAVEMAQSLKPDVITMDYEMPVMDGVTAVRQIMAQRPVPILMFSSMTYEGARTTLDALDAGATDFMPKNFAEVSRDSAALKKKLHDRLLQIAKPQKTMRSAPVSFKAPPPAAEKRVPLKGRVNLLVIGASTGGPVALADVLTKLPANFPAPIVLVQHMPENFTKAFAERLNRQCKIEVREAVDGDQLRPGLALLAPGGKQLMVEKRGAGCVRVLPGDSRVNYKPSVDITFGSAANSFDKHVLGVVLTGMGSDGCEGARLLKRKGSTIWSQDQASCVIYGMPMAVAREKLTDKVLSLQEIGPALVREL
jgi:two-component system, chemotaxis family, protein-glutamate methylesterase/glutaminase